MTLCSSGVGSTSDLAGRFLTGISISYRVCTDSFGPPSQKNALTVFPVSRYSSGISISSGVQITGLVTVSPSLQKSTVNVFGRP